MGIARRGCMVAVTEQLAHKLQVFVRHDGVARRRMAKVVRSDLAELRVVADRAPARDEAVCVSASGGPREQRIIRAASSGRRVDDGPGGLAEGHTARPGPRVEQSNRAVADVAPAKIEHFAPAAAGERQQPDRGDRFGPFGLAGGECASELGKLVRVEEPGDVAPRVLPGAETGLGVRFTETEFLGPEHHRPQDFEDAVGRAGLVPDHRVEPRDHILGTDTIHRHRAERGL